MACGNNMVSRASLQSQPTVLIHPSAGSANALMRERAAESARGADRQITRAREAVQQASTETAVKSALDAAEKALNATRRAGGSEARAALRSLERDVAQLRREAATKQQDIARREHHERELQATAVSRFDHLSPVGLGVIPRVIQVESGGGGGSNLDMAGSVPDATVVDNRPIYETDALNRTVRAVTVLDHLAADTPRSGLHQRAAGGDDRLDTDDGGHIFATLFGGVKTGINIQAMDFAINRGAYRALEILWAQQIDAGGQVRVEVSFHFVGDSRRPDQFEVTFDLGDGDTVAVPFYQ